MTSLGKTLKNTLFGSAHPRALLPGLGLALGLTVLAAALSAVAGRLLAGHTNPFSTILLAIVLGLLFRNTLGLSPVAEPGVAYGIRKVLRFGIVLMGIRLSLLSVLRIGAVAVGLVLVCITAALALTVFLSRKVGISPKLGTLIAAGTSICGVSAIVATAPAIEADEAETAYAIGTITLFGLLATLIYPYGTELLLGLDTAQAGFFLGTAIHDTSQVTGAALIYDQLWGGRTPLGLSGADIAITTKLVRNTFLILVIPFLGWRSGRQTEATSGGLLQYVPLFVVGYVLMGALRTLGDGWFGPASAGWTVVWQSVAGLATWAIALAIAAVGLNTDLRRLTHLGVRPIGVGLAAALAVGLISFTLVTLFSGALVF